MNKFFKKPFGIKNNRTNWNQRLKSKETKIKTKKRIKKSLRYLIFLKKNENNIDYTNIRLLKAFITKTGKIRPRRKSRILLWQQRKLSKSIRRARVLGLLPFIATLKI